MNKNSNVKTKKLLFISTRQFWPPSSGKEVTLYHNCKGLHDKYGYDIYLFCFADKKADKSRVSPDFIHEVIYTDVPGIKEAAPRVLWRSFIKGTWPIQNALFFKKTISQQLREYYDKIEPDALIFDMVRLAPYIDSLPQMTVPHILIEDDLLAKRYQRQLDSRGEGSISGYLSDSMSSGMNRMLNSKWISSFVLKGEIKRLERYEAVLPTKFDFITFISPIEAREFNQKYHTNKATTLTMGADVEYCAAGVPGKHIPNSISVVGNFAYGSNAASMEWTNANVLPRLPEDVSYYVIGKFPDELKRKINNPRIVSLGYVDDFRTVVKSTDVYVAPILYGTGIKTKIVEAMAMGIPVVTNSIGAEGLDVKNGKELFIQDEPASMAQTIRMLLTDQQLRKQIAEKGQAFVREHHNWNSIYDSFGHMGL